MFFYRWPHSMAPSWTGINRIKMQSESNHFPVLISHPQANTQTTDIINKDNNIHNNLIT